MGALPAEKIKQKYTYEDYLDWSNDDRWEIIDGEAYAMSPAPSVYHQKYSMSLCNIFYNYLKGKPCQVFSAPIDVRLPKENQKKENSDTIVQPDIIIVCDKRKIEEKGIVGAPDLIVEILSPSTAEMDTKRKLLLYEKAGVKEYWIVDTSNLTAMVFKLGENGVYGKPDFYGSRDQVEVGIFKDLKVELKEVFGLAEEEEPVVQIEH